MSHTEEKSNTAAQEFKPLTETSNLSKPDDIESEDPNLVFKPVIELTQEIEIPKSEEDDVLTARAIIARLSTADGKSEWKERGRGDLFIKKHQKTGYYRVILIRDQVMKLACNHHILPNIQLKEVPQNDKCIMYGVSVDHAQEPPSSEFFTIRFTTTEKCVEFVEMFKKAQKEMEELLKKD
ncbi:Ran-specific GTPase-activating protein [Entamoeba marina]